MKFKKVFTDNLKYEDLHKRAFNIYLKHLRAVVNIFGISNSDDILKAINTLAENKTKQNLNTLIDKIKKSNLK